METFCDAEGIDWEKCGKVIVAVGEEDLEPLQTIYDRGQQNGVECAMIDKARLKELEPHAAGIKAIHVPESGIVDYGQVCLRFAERTREAGSDVLTGAGVNDIQTTGYYGDTALDTDAGEVRAKYLINCAGLHSDRVCRLTGQRPPVKIIPFRGEYFELRPHARKLVNNLIYPTPDPAFPFLGVHFTRMIHADRHGPQIECGPNAVLAFRREGYHRTSLHLGDLAEVLTHKSFWQMSLKFWRTGLGEMWRSASKGAFVKALQRLLPEIQAADLEPAPAGVRAQALGPNGKLLDDFSVQATDRVINVLNAPSPAATASLSVAEHIAGLLEERMDRKHQGATEPARPAAVQVV